MFRNAKESGLWRVEERWRFDLRLGLAGSDPANLLSAEGAAD
jgi:hypothetical protein